MQIQTICISIQTEQIVTRIQYMHTDATTAGLADVMEGVIHLMLTQHEQDEPALSEVDIIIDQLCEERNVAELNRIIYKRGRTT
jgi:hypothetical protein